MAWPGPQDGLGQGGPRLKWAKGRFGSKNDEKVKVLRMEFSIMENLSGLQESIFSLSRGPPTPFWRNFIKFTDFPPSPCLGSLGLISRPHSCIQIAGSRKDARYHLQHAVSRAKRIGATLLKEIPQQVCPGIGSDVFSILLLGMGSEGIKTHFGDLRIGSNRIRSTSFCFENQIGSDTEY